MTMRVPVKQPDYAEVPLDLTIRHALVLYALLDHQLHVGYEPTFEELLGYCNTQFALSNIKFTEFDLKPVLKSYVKQGLISEFQKKEVVSDKVNTRYRFNTECYQLEIFKKPEEKPQTIKKVGS